MLSKSRPRPTAWVALGLVALMMVAGCSTSRDVDTFYFQMDGLQTPRQGGAQVDLIVGLRYADGTTPQQIPDYRPIAELAEGFLQPTEALPANISWESLLRTMVPAIMQAGPISGVSVVLRVHPRCDDKATTDLLRSAIYTMGDMDPIPFDIASEVPCQTVASVP